LDEYSDKFNMNKTQTFFKVLKEYNPNSNLEMLTQREQLMEDIDCIVFEFFDEHYNMDDDYRSEKDELVRTLCDAVCKNFPTN
tara:strand:- start:1105 stop:1353 length:249 start_codon:yes stop_codon:yes gene_type:complete